MDITVQCSRIHSKLAAAQVRVLIYEAGVAGTGFGIDPTNDLLFIGLVQHCMLNLEDLSRARVFQALVALAN